MEKPTYERKLLSKEYEEFLKSNTLPEKLILGFIKKFLYFMKNK